MILVIDNYDSFTWNLVQYLWELGAEVEVVRNDALTVDEVAARRPAGVLLSPGPGAPKDAGITVEVVRRHAGRFPIFGVCLGHQAIGEAFGGEIVRAERIMHGKVSPIRHRGQGVFAGLPDGFEGTRYHSLLVRRETLPAELEITAETDAGEIMGLAHRTLPVQGVQFHPESILSAGGHALLRNWLDTL